MNSPTKDCFTPLVNKLRLSATESATGRGAPRRPRLFFRPLAASPFLHHNKPRSPRLLTRLTRFVASLRSLSRSFPRSSTDTLWSSCHQRLRPGSNPRYVTEHRSPAAVGPHKLGAYRGPEESSRKHAPPIPHVFRCGEGSFRSECH